MMQIVGRILIMLYDFENLNNKTFDEEFNEGFRILKQYQIKKILE
jgi:hypothetical protein